MNGKTIRFNKLFGDGRNAALVALDQVVAHLGVARGSQKAEQLLGGQVMEAIAHGVTWKRA